MKLIILAIAAIAAIIHYICWQIDRTMRADEKRRRQSAQRAQRVRAERLLWKQSEDSEWFANEQFAATLKEQQ
jgi:hypothetical protein